MDALVSRINDELPHDIRVFDAVRVTKSFNCKQSCDRRRYAYLLPSCLLASNDEIDAAFASVGYGPEKIEEMPKRGRAGEAGGRAAERLADLRRGCPTSGGDVRGVPRGAGRHLAIAAVLASGATGAPRHRRDACVALRNGTTSGSKNSRVDFRKASEKLKKYDAGQKIYSRIRGGRPPYCKR